MCVAWLREEVERLKDQDRGRWSARLGPSAPSSARDLRDQIADRARRLLEAAATACRWLIDQTTW